MTATPAAPRSRRAVRPGVRSAAAAVMLMVAALLIPFAVVGAWAKHEVFDTENFTRALEPLSAQPEVQTFVADRVVAAIDDRVDLDRLVGDALSGLDSLPLPGFDAASEQLQGAAADALRSAIRMAASELVASPQFARLWRLALQQAHGQMIAAFEGRPDAVLQLGEGGELSLELGAMIDDVRQRLIDQGIDAAAIIPSVEVSVPIVDAEALVTARAAYHAAEVTGAWLPWCALVLAVAGLVVARRRWPALAWFAGGTALTMLLLAGVLMLGRPLLVAAVGKLGVPMGVADPLVERLGASLQLAIEVGIVLSLVVLAAAWAVLLLNARRRRRAGGLPRGSSMPQEPPGLGQSPAESPR